MRERGLSSGNVTADVSDWNLEAQAIEAPLADRQMDMDAQISCVEYHGKLARRTFGRPPAHVLLLHEADLAALFVPDRISEQRSHG